MTITLQVNKTNILLVLLGLGTVLVTATATSRDCSLTSSEWASWAQAFGSIAAIVAAFLIGDLQAKSTIAAVGETARISRQQKTDALIGLAEVADSIADKCLTLFSETGFNWVGLMLAQVDAPLRLLNTALAAVPMHEIGSATAVFEFIQMRTSATNLESSVGRAMDSLVVNDMGQIISWDNAIASAARIASDEILSRSSKLKVALASINQQP